MRCKTSILDQDTYLRRRKGTRQVAQRQSSPMSPHEEICRASLSWRGWLREEGQLISELSLLKSLEMSCYGLFWQKYLPCTDSKCY